MGKISHNTIILKEKINLSEAYSDLKILYHHLKLNFDNVKRINKSLRQELLDYQSRYNHLIKYINQ